MSFSLFVFKLFLGVLSIPKNFSTIGVAVPEIHLRARRRPTQKNADFRIFFWKFVFWPEMLSNRLVWPWVDVETQKIYILGDILP